MPYGEPKATYIYMKERYPKYHAAFMRTIRRLRNNNLYKQKFPDVSDEEIWDWWISKESIETWYAKNKRQLRLDL